MKRKYGEIKIGDRFGRLTVLSLESSIGRNKYMHSCECDCGSRKNINRLNLLKGYSSSCGCLRREITSERSKKHGKSNSDIYTIWSSMKARCDNYRNPAYKDYGGRGIGICERWRSFASFLDDMGERPTKRHSIERVDNDAGYCKENCIWAMAKGQARNRRNNSVLTDQEGTVRCIAEWSEILDINADCLYGRRKLGWSDEAILNTGKRKIGHRRVLTK